MRGINFIKMVASGNDFIIAETSNPACPAGRQKPVTRNPKLLAKQICNRKFGIGADGLLLLEKSKIADTKMLIFNPDGSEARMCGNGARCIALYSARNQKPETRNQLKVETKAGIIEAEVKGDNVKIKLTGPKDIKLDIPIKINDRPLKVNFIDTGVPHTVVFVSGLDELDVVGIGRLIRYHRKFSPQGTNVNFVELIDEDNIRLRTYERGVEDETLACGTGAVAAAIITVTSPSTPFRTGTEQSRSASYQLPVTRKKYKLNVKTKSGEILKVYFEKINHKFKNVWLEGKAKIVYKGVYYV